MGVFARLVRAHYEIQMPSERYVYIGSAHSNMHGLKGRTASLTKKANREDETRTEYRQHEDIMEKGLKRRGRFITLMVIKKTTNAEGKTHDVWRMVALAKAIVAVWLGCLGSPSSGLQEL